jgi:shikimate dehydrogenase
MAVQWPWLATMAESRSSVRDRFLTGLIGAPIASSAAPAMHEQAAAALGVRCHYQLIEVANADAAALRALLDGVRRLGFAGVNVTFLQPVPLLDELSPGARTVGAVNTVVARDGRLVGYNTDTSGFARAIGDLVAGSNRGAVALIGAGGVGKAIAFALAGLAVAELNIFDADRARAEALSAQLHGRLKVRVADDAAGRCRSCRRSTQRRSACCRIAAAVPEQPSQPVVADASIRAALDAAALRRKRAAPAS